MFKALPKLAVALAAALSIIPAAQAASAYPSKPITLVVPFAPGGTVNLMGRLLANRMSEALGQTVIVENKPGGGGSIGANFVAKAASDGYTLLLATMGQQSILPLISKNLPYNADKDFAPVALFSTVPNVLAVSKMCIRDRAVRPPGWRRGARRRTRLASRRRRPPRARRPPGRPGGTVPWCGCGCRGRGAGARRPVAFRRG